ncbi:MAG: GNAT family N-acetyltransferase, partial [Candidatus Hermodarchaeota archaeon]
MTSRYTEGKVRDFELTIEEAARLAECFNSFDDPESWPGGFTHGNPFTAQRIYDDLSKSKPIRRIVAHTDDKIVGHCDLCYPEVDPESSYVGLLGVNPAYQRQGFGKALLIEAAETAVKFNKRRIDLHTWAGNLKALPVYKKCGYNWVPGTRVLMESHIPGIIGCDFFKEFFDRHYWYDSFKREIKQEMDNIVENGIGVFKYRFEGDNGDFLDVTVDREAKGVCGFVLKMDGKTISADVCPEKHVGFIGFGKTLVKLIIKNEGDEQLPYSVVVSPNEKISVDFLNATTGSIDTGQEIEVLVNYEVLPKADHLDRQAIPDIKVETQAEWSLTLGGKFINLYSGVIPQ